MDAGVPAPSLFKQRTIAHTHTHTHTPWNCVPTAVLTLDSSNPMAAGCKGNFAAEAAGCDPSLCRMRLHWLQSTLLGSGDGSPAPRTTVTHPATGYRMQPKSAPEATGCAASCLLEAAWCR